MIIMSSILKLLSAIVPPFIIAIGLYFKGKNDQQRKDVRKRIDEQLAVQAKILVEKETANETNKKNRVIANDIIKRGGFIQ